MSFFPGTTRTRKLLGIQNDRNTNTTQKFWTLWVSIQSVHNLCLEFIFCLEYLDSKYPLSFILSTHSLTHTHSLSLRYGNLEGHHGLPSFLFFFFFPSSSFLLLSGRHIQGTPLLQSIFLPPQAIFQPSLGHPHGSRNQIPQHPSPFAPAPRTSPSSTRHPLIGPGILQDSVC